MLDHAGLGEREAGEDADHVERDDLVHLGAVVDQQAAGGATARITMPFEKASRSPRFCRARGR